VHFEDGTVYAEPGVDTAGLSHTVAWFRERNLFFGGCHVAERRGFTGGGDPRRGGAVVAA
jgi:gamma-glutamyltranspeptidase/glutathione hydrolase